MKHEEFLEVLRQDPDYVQAEEELTPILDIADDVLRLRLEKGWSQSELARRAGTRQANISKLENGLGNPTLAFLRKVALALETEFVIRMGPEPESESARVIVRQEVRIIQPETLWGSKSSQRSSPTRWANFEIPGRYSTQVGQYEAA